MKFSDTLIGELQEILQEDFGVETTQEEASSIGNDLVSYIDALSKIAQKAQPP